MLFVQTALTADELMPIANEPVLAAGFFDVDISALLNWRFNGREAARITVPVLYVGGTNSGPLLEEVRTQMLGWLPDVEDVRIAGADHSLALTHPSEIATALARFIRRRSITPSRRRDALGPPE